MEPWRRALASLRDLRHQATEARINNSAAGGRIIQKARSCNDPYPIIDRGKALGAAEASKNTATRRAFCFQDPRVMKNLLVRSWGALSGAPAGIWIYFAAMDARPSSFSSSIWATMPTSALSNCDNTEDGLS